jgi:hypothetical protein
LFNPASNEAGITASADLVNGEYVDTYTLGAGLTLQETKFTVTPSKQYVLTFNRKGPAHTDTFSCFTADGTDMQKEAPSTTEVGVQNADGICTVRSTIGPFPEGTATCSLLHISNSSSESVILSSIFLTEKTPYTMLQLSSEGSYIRGASDWSTLNVVQQEYVRRKIHTGDPIEGIISEDTQVAQITKITYK